MQGENSMEENLPEQNQADDDRLDTLLSKALSVWLWAILLGGTIGLTYYWGFYMGRQSWLKTSMVLLFGTAILICLTTTWLFLFLYLKDAIIPDVVYRSNRAPGSIERQVAGQRLMLAYLFMIASGVLILITRVLFSLFVPTQ